jgi:hypothetical protein
VLTLADEFPYHQTAATFARVSTSDKHWNDGHYICLCDHEGRVCLIAVVRFYQNNDVCDGFVCVRHQDRQHNLRVSRRLRPEMDFFGVGPLRMEFLEPMRRIRLVLEDNASGIACDLVCHTTRVPYEDPVDVLVVDDRLMQERAVYELVGGCEGWVSVAGERVTLTPADSTFFRNHSWGTMPGRGGPRQHGAPPRTPRSHAGLRNWVLFEMPDHGGFYTFQENGAGERQSTHARLLLADRQADVASVRHELRFHPGCSRLAGGAFTLVDDTGRQRRYEIERDFGWVYCQGGGYFGGFDDGLGQGVYRGDYHEEREVWDVSHPVRVVETSGRTRTFNGAWAESFVRLRSDGQVGHAHFECVVLGSYAPYGVTGETDAIL